MIAPRLLAHALTSAVVVGACSSRVEVPEIPILDPPAFEAAKREPEPKPPVKYIEVPKPLATRCAGWSATPAAARARTSKSISW